MRIWTSHASTKVLVSLFGFVALGMQPAFAVGRPRISPCLYPRMLADDGPGTASLYLAPHFAWVVRIDDADASIEVHAVHSSQVCRIRLEDVRYVYGGRKTLVLRVTEVSADYLFFFDPRTCMPSGPSVDLGVITSVAREREVLRRVGLCDASIASGGR